MLPTLLILGVTENTFYRAINLNGPALSIDGNNWEASAGAPNFSIAGLTFANQSVTLVPATDANRAYHDSFLLLESAKRHDKRGPCRELPGLGICMGR